MKTIKSKIQPNPKECDRWVDLHADPMGGVVKYFNGVILGPQLVVQQKVHSLLQKIQK